MDKDYIKFLLTGEINPDRLCQNNETIPVEITELMKQATPTKNKSIFIPTKQSLVHNRYYLAIKCDCCDKVVTTGLMYMSTIVRFFDQLPNHKFLCVDCSEHEQVSQSKHIKEITKVEKDKDRITWEEFKQIFLIPKKFGKCELKTLFGRHSYDDKIMQYIQQMKYEDFLNTMYWRIIRGYKIRKAGRKCSLCGGTEDLRVHHARYDRHGLEHLYDVSMHDLIVLCKDCHHKFHDIPSENSLLPCGMTQEEYDEL